MISVKVKIVWLLFALLGAITTCSSQSRIPEPMPENVSFDYHQGGAMSRSYRRYRVGNGVLEFEELRAGAKRTWNAKVSREEMSDIYRVFVAHRFDAIKNDERKGIVHDAGSESIGLSAGPGKFFRVTCGHNSPLSGGNLKRYLAVRKVLEDLAARLEKTAGVIVTAKSHL